MTFSPIGITEIFQYTENPIYKRKSGNHIWRKNITTVHFNSKSGANWEAKIWNLIAEEIKAS